MDLTWLESILYGLISGFTEFVPVSSQAHRVILAKLFGISEQPYLLDLLSRTAVIAALFVSLRGHITRLYRELRLLQTPKRRRQRQPDPKSAADIRLIRSGVVPALLTFLLYLVTRQWNSNLVAVSLFLLLNGIILYIPMYLPQGNKDARSMTRLDSFFFGACSGLGAFPGLSSLGFTSGLSIVRGADRKEALNWGFLFSFLGLFGFWLIDLFSLFSGGLVGIHFLSFLQCIVSAALSYLGAYLAIMLMRFMSVKIGFSTFAYYSWGASLFAFILYLTV